MIRLVPRALVGLAIACVVAPVVPATETAAQDPDPWSGKPRVEVVQLLGEPDKAKTTRDGREILTYKFDRIAPEAAAHPEVILLHVPGIGVVARVDRSRSAETMEVGPTVYDKYGRPAGGRLTGTTTASKSYDPKTGEVTDLPDLLDKPRVTSKVKLQLTLDPDGRVESWSTSGKE